METFKKYLAYIGGGLLSLAAIVLGFKLRKLKQLEAEKKVDNMEKDVQTLRDEVKKHREDANEKERVLRSKEAEYRHLRRLADAERSKPTGGGSTDGN